MRFPWQARISQACQPQIQERKTRMSDFDHAPGPAPYMSGFGNEFATEALPGALPAGQNSPQRAPYGLYAEQLSGTAFTAPRADNRRSWLYRIRPSAMHQPFEPLAADRIVSDFDEVETTP